MGERRSEYGVVVGKYDEKIPLVRPTCGWVDNARNDLKKTVSDDVYWINVAYDRAGLVAGFCKLRNEPLQLLTNKNTHITFT